MNDLRTGKAAGLEKYGGYQDLTKQVGEMGKIGSVDLSKYAKMSESDKLFNLAEKLGSRYQAYRDRRRNR